MLQVVVAKIAIPSFKVQIYGIICNLRNNTMPKICICSLTKKEGEQNRPPSFSFTVLHNNAF